MKKAELATAFVDGINEIEFSKKLEEKGVKLSKKDGTEIVDYILSIMQAGLKEDKVLDLFGFCKMTVERKDEHTGRNPQTGKDMVIPAKNMPKCKFSKTFKDYINE